MLMTQLRAVGRAPIFAVAMSGFGMNADESKSRSAGYDHHLIKPVNLEDLAKLLVDA